MGALTERVIAQQLPYLATFVKLDYSSLLTRSGEPHQPEYICASFRVVGLAILGRDPVDPGRIVLDGDDVAIRVVASMLLLVAVTVPHRRARHEG